MSSELEGFSSIISLSSISSIISSLIFSSSWVFVESSEDTASFSLVSLGFLLTAFAKPFNSDLIWFKSKSLPFGGLELSSSLSSSC